MVLFDLMAKPLHASPDTPNSILNGAFFGVDFGIDSKGNKIVVENGVLMFNELGLNNSIAPLPSRGEFHLEVSPNPSAQFTTLTYDLPPIYSGFNFFDRQSWATASNHFGSKPRERNSPN